MGWLSSHRRREVHLRAGCTAAMTDQNLRQLCYLIVEDVHGSFLTHIFKQIATFGRLSTPAIAQKCRLPQRQTKMGLSALLQLRLIQYHSISAETATYQVDLHSAYDLLRTGKLVQLAEENHGSIAALIIETLAETGFSSTVELRKAVLGAIDREQTISNGVNSSTKLATAMKNLVNDGFLAQVRPTHLQIPFDARDDVQGGFEEVTVGGAKGKALNAERTNNVASELESRLDTHVSYGQLEASLMTNENDPLENHVYLAPNYGRIVRSIRNATITKHVNKTLGKASSRLATAMMQQVPLQVVPFEPDPNSRQQIEELRLQQIEDDLQHTSIPNGTNGHVGTNGVHEDDFAGEEDIEDGLRLLHEGPYPFIVLNPVTSAWAVDACKVATWLRDQEIMKLISSRVGFIGMRLLRILIDKGKVDERALQEASLSQAKEMRQALAELQSMSLIQLQEVPRETQRQPSRTIYLWFFDSVRARDVLLGELYKSMARAYQRLQAVERQRMESTLQKIEREDVRDRIDEVVVGREKVELQRFQAKEIWLMGEIQRMDESVALLRDV